MWWRLRSGGSCRRTWTPGHHGLENEGGFTASAQGFGKLAKSVGGRGEVRKEPESPREYHSEPCGAAGLDPGSRFHGRG